MQLLLDLDDRTSMLSEIHQRLHRHFGPPDPFLRPDPVSQLVLAMIGGRTRGEVSKAAFVTLFNRYGSWSAVRDAPVDDIRNAICGVSFADAKAVHLKATLAVITGRDDRPSLGDIEPLSVEQALVWLERLPGVGRKVAAATLNFSTLNKAALVIDTHHLRVLRRLRLVGPRASLERAYDGVAPLLPATWSATELADHHHFMKTLGQTICRHGFPKCRLCPLRDLCATGLA